MIKLRNILFEGPDFISTQNKKLTWRQSDSIPFGYESDTLYFGKFSDFHKNSMGFSREHLKTAGRLWVYNQVISFWTLDHPLEQVMLDINKSKRKYKDQPIIVTPNWLVDTISFMLIKTYPDYYSDWSVLKPLSTVMKETVNGECGEYSLIWDKQDDYRSIYGGRRKD